MRNNWKPSAGSFLPWPNNKNKNRHGATSPGVFKTRLIRHIAAKNYHEWPELMRNQQLRAYSKYSLVIAHWIHNYATSYSTFAPLFRPKHHRWGFSEFPTNFYPNSPNRQRRWINIIDFPRRDSLTIPPRESRSNFRDPNVSTWTHNCRGWALIIACVW